MAQITVCDKCGKTPVRCFSGVGGVPQKLVSKNVNVPINRGGNDISVATLSLTVNREADLCLMCCKSIAEQLVSQMMELEDGRLDGCVEVEA